MASTVQLSHLVTPDRSRTIPVNNIAEMNGGFTLRNKLIDGKFDFWLGGTAQTGNGYGSSTMWANNIHPSATGFYRTVSRQPLIPGVDLPAIEVPTARYFHRTVITDSLADPTAFCTSFVGVEDVRTLAGKTATLSFYARADSTRKVFWDFAQLFGSGGSAQVNTHCSTVLTLSNVWKRYVMTFNVPSLAGKAIGTDDWWGISFFYSAGAASLLATRCPGLGQQAGTFDVACVQLEEGAVATPFEELPWSVSSPLVSRYFQQWAGVDIHLAIPAYVSPSATTQLNAYPAYSVPMRKAPTVSSNLTDGNFGSPPEAGQWGYVLDGIQWGTRTGNFYSFGLSGLGSGLRVGILASAPYSVYPSALILGLGTYINADARC